MDMATVKKLAITTMTATSILFGAASASAQDDRRLKDVVKEVKESKQVAVAVQSEIDNLTDNTNSLLNRYKSVLKAIAGLESFIAQQKRVIENQKIEISKLETSISGVRSVKNQIPGLMEDMLDNLEEFVKQDLPFEKERRMARIEQARDVLVDPGFADPERFRVILEAYKAEATYGSNVNAWSGDLADGRSVNFVRIGRIGLYYQTKDGAEARAYNNGEWVLLDASQNGQIRNLLKMARRQAPFNALVLPIAAPEEK